MTASIKKFFCKPFWSDWRTISVVYALIPIIIGLLKWTKDNDTYHIYKSVFWNTINQLPLYEFYDYLKGDADLLTLEENEREECKRLFDKYIEDKSAVRY